MTNPKAAQSSNQWLPSELATEIVKDRQKKYNHPAVVYNIWADLLKPVIGHRPTVQECGMMLMQLKCAREIATNYPLDYRDNVDDMAGYANVQHMIKEAIRDGSSYIADSASGVGGAQLSTPATLGAHTGADGGGGGT